MAEENYCFHSPDMQLNRMSDVLELYKASQIIITPDKPALRKLNLQSSDILRHTLSNDSSCSDKLSANIRQEINDALNFPFYASLERIATKRNVEHYNVDHSGTIRVLKTSYCSPNTGNTIFLKLAVEDFNFIQSVHREEIKHLESWVVEQKLDKLKFARQKVAYCFFSAAATIYIPKLSDARIIWAKHAMLCTMIDDFFDVAGSRDEFLNLIQLTEKWDVDIESDCCSEEVGIIFSAIHDMSTEIATKAFTCQRRSVTNHIIQIWLDLLKGMFREAEWSRNKYVPSIDEYIENAHITVALGPVTIPSLYVVGPELSEEVVHSLEFKKMFKLMSTCGRILNDIQSLERETKQGKLNFISLLMIHGGGGGGITKEEAIDQARKLLKTQREELLSLIVKKGSIVPRDCKELFWKITKVVHLFYDSGDGFTSQHLMKAVNDNIIYEPMFVNLP